MTVPATLKWVLLALLGIAVAAAVAIAASNLASRQIGLASEPISAGDALAPRAASQPKHKVKPEPEPTAPETTTPESTTPSGSGDDNASSGNGADD